MNLNYILVPVEGSSADDEAIRLACLAARQGKTKVLAIYVAEVQRNLPLDAEDVPQLSQGEHVLERSEQIAHAVRATLETELLQARVAGPALVDEAIERKVDLIVMGIPYRKPLGDFHLGATANYILKNAPCPVWLCREVAGSALPDTKPKP